jgi:hypothetical protein
MNYSNVKTVYKKHYVITDSTKNVLFSIDDSEIPDVAVKLTDLLPLIRVARVLIPSPDISYPDRDLRACPHSELCEDRFQVVSNSSYQPTLLVTASLYKPGIKQEYILKLGPA